MLENRSQAIGFVHLTNQAAAGTAVADQCLAQTFARLSGTTLADSVANRPARIVGRRVVVRPVSISYASISNVEVDIRKLDEDLAVEAESLAEYFSAVRRAK